MGEDATRIGRPATHERPSLDGVLVVDTFEAIAPFYGLNDAAAFHELTEYLVGLACRDQEDAIEENQQSLSERRQEGRRLALEMKNHASDMIASLDAIYQALERFDTVVSIHPPLLEAIFEVDAGSPTRLVFPNEISVLHTFFREADWGQVTKALGRLADMPVRAKLARGPVPNETLRRAVSACRTYWKEAEGLPWSMSSLKVTSVREAGQARNLKGRCEAFVSDICNQCDIAHELRDLCSAWTAVDRS